MKTISEISSDVSTAIGSVSGFKGRVFAIMARQGTDFPFATFQRDSVRFDTCKDGVFGTECTFTIRVFSPSYYSGIDLLEEAINAVMGMPDYDTTIDGSNEDYIEDVFVQSATISLQTK